MATETESRPTSGQLKVDWENHSIDGVALVGPWSANDGAEFSPESLSDVVRICNESSFLTPVNNHHFAKKAFEGNGGIEPGSVRLVGDTVFGKWRLNPERGTTRELLWDAENNPESICISIEIPHGQVSYRRGAKNRTITKVKKVRCFAIGKQCGTTQGMTRKLDRGETMATRKPKTTEELESQFPDLVAQIKQEAAGRAECACQEKDLESTVATLTAERDEARSELDSMITANEKAARVDELREKWAAQLDGVDLTLLPDSDAGKRLREKADISDEKFDELAGVEAADATSFLVDRAADIKAALDIAETFRGRAETKQEKPGLSAIGLEKPTEQSDGNKAALAFLGVN